MRTTLLEYLRSDDDVPRLGTYVRFFALARATYGAAGHVALMKVPCPFSSPAYIPYRCCIPPSIKGTAHCVHTVLPDYRATEDRRALLCGGCSLQRSVLYTTVLHAHSAIAVAATQLAAALQSVQSAPA